MAKYQSRLYIPRDLLNHRDLTAEEERRIARRGRSLAQGNPLYRNATDDAIQSSESYNWEYGRRDSNPDHVHDYVYELLRHNVRNVASIVLEYDESKIDGLDANDLFSWGLQGVAYAATKWDPDVGFRFSSYAGRMARNFINSGIQEHGREIRLPSRVQSAYMDLLHRGGIPCALCQEEGYDDGFNPQLDRVKQDPYDGYFYCPNGHRLRTSQVHNWLQAQRATTQSASVEMESSQEEDWEREDAFAPDPFDAGSEAQLDVLDEFRYNPMLGTFIHQDEDTYDDSEQGKVQWAICRAILDLPELERDFMYIYGEFSAERMERNVGANLVPRAFYVMDRDPEKQALDLSEKSGDARKIQTAEYLGVPQPHYRGPEILFVDARDRLVELVRERIAEIDPSMAEEDWEQALKME